MQLYCAKVIVAALLHLEFHSTAAVVANLPRVSSEEATHGQLTHLSRVGNMGIDAATSATPFPLCSRKYGSRLMRNINDVEYK